MKSLDARVQDAECVLSEIHEALVSCHGQISERVVGDFLSLIKYRSEISNWRMMIEARSNSMLLMKDLPSLCDHSDCVVLGNSKIKYNVARFMIAQSYLSSTWALADSILGACGQTLCNAKVGRNISSPPQIVNHFISNKTRMDAVSGAFSESIHHSFGWPIAISYAIRNEFVHGGASSAEANFFLGANSLAGFRISDAAWGRVIDKVESINLTSTHHRLAPAWPQDPKDDLRVLLEICEQELDDALGVLLGSACGMLKIHLGFMLGQD
nr:hypothetical protein [uncultured Pseudomonas sp.]